MKIPIRQQLQKASQIVADGGVIAYPTESCFGLGCYPKNSTAVKRILQLKHRSASKGMILIGSDFYHLRPYIKELPEQLIEKMLNSWPAAITWLVPAAHWVPDWLTGDSDKIAIRIPGHAIARELCRICDHALVSTSANKAGQPACVKKNQIERIFATEIDYIVDYPCGRSTRPSKIIDIESETVIRAA